MTVRAYAGSGQLHYGERQISCSFSLTQSADGDVRLECSTAPDAPPPGVWLAGLVGPMPAPERFEGRLQDGRPVAVRGGFLAFPGGWSQSDGAKATFELNGPGAEAIIGAETIHGVGEWRFTITNLLLDREQWQEDAGSRVIVLSSDGLSVRIRDITTAASRRLFSGKGHIGVTSCLELAGSLTFDHAQDVACDLCAILSIAQGTLVSWICAERTCADSVIFAYHPPAVTRPHNGALPLIDPNEPGDFARFVAAVYATFRLKKVERGLPVLARALSDVRTTGFLETRALQVSSLIEYIVSRDADIRQCAFILDQRTFDKKGKRTKAALRDALTAVFTDATEVQIETMCRHAPQLNRVPFADLLASTCSRLGAEIPIRDLRRFVVTRNSLVHRGGFTSKSPWSEFRLMLSIVDRLILGLLDYRGPYVDANTLKRVEPRP